MGIFDDGYQQAIIDAGRQPIGKTASRIVDLSRTNEDY